MRNMPVFLLKCTTFILLNVVVNDLLINPEVIEKFSLPVSSLWWITSWFINILVSLLLLVSLEEGIYTKNFLSCVYWIMPVFIFGAFVTGWSALSGLSGFIFVIWIISFIIARNNAMSMEQSLESYYEGHLNRLIKRKRTRNASISGYLYDLAQIENSLRVAIDDNIKASKRIFYRKHELLAFPKQRERLEKCKNKIQEEYKQIELLEEKMLKELREYFKEEVYFKKGGRWDKSLVYSNKKRYHVEFSDEGNLISVERDFPECIMEDD
ncbi:hypothetical protein HBP98_17030 [Listeria booriae]|uniref:Uncharacterized protein n=1 Tax=Listeria booriae TaxID=1552123 RepID=A0A7X1A9S4_9LIST|nr:hypothetical protein [Listeria booriae]MBC2373718.1 hypothetical protein [Listeria booriae]